jgi:hypothetical protein
LTCATDCGVQARLGIAFPVRGRAARQHGLFGRGHGVATRPSEPEQAAASPATFLGWEDRAKWVQVKILRLNSQY